MQIDQQFATTNVMDFLLRNLVLRAALSAWRQRIKAVIAIGGGVSGLIANFADHRGSMPLLANFVWLLFFFVYLWGVWIGLRIMEQQLPAEREFKIFLLLQVPLLQSSFFSFFFAALGSTTIMLRPSGMLDFGWTIGSGWTFSLLTPQAEAGIGMNLLPVIFLLLLRFMSSRM